MLLNQSFLLLLFLFVLLWNWNPFIFDEMKEKKNIKKQNYNWNYLILEKLLNAKNASNKFDVRVNWPELFGRFKIDVIAAFFFKCCCFFHLLFEINRVKWIWWTSFDLRWLIYGNMRLDWSSIVDSESDALKLAADMGPKLGSLHCRCRRHSYHRETDCLNNMAGTANDIYRVRSAHRRYSIVMLAWDDSILDSFSRYPKHSTGSPMFPI